MDYFNVLDNEEKFEKYGRVLKNYDFTRLVQMLREKTPLPEDGFVYLASSKVLESLDIYKKLQSGVFGGIPMQLGYCNGRNNKLNCLEYHCCSEVCVAAEDLVLLLGKREDIDIHTGTYDTKNVEAFLVPAGTGVELYATTLHYAPCNPKKEQGYHMANGLLRGTNAPLESKMLVVQDSTVGLQSAETGTQEANREQPALMAACNKWLLAHREAPEAEENAYIGLTGCNIEIEQSSGI